jgi:hypothetical protein
MPGLAHPVKGDFRQLSKELTIAGQLRAAGAAGL